MNYVCGQSTSLIERWPGTQRVENSHGLSFEWWTTLEEDEDDVDGAGRTAKPYFNGRLDASGVPIGGT